MGGYGSGRSGGRPTVESALRLDIDAMIRWGGIEPGAHVRGEMTFDFYDDQIAIKFESRVGDPWDSWLRLQYVIHDYWSGVIGTEHCSAQPADACNEMRLRCKRRRLI